MSDDTIILILLFASLLANVGLSMIVGKLRTDLITVRRKKVQQQKEHLMEMNFNAFGLTGEELQAEEDAESEYRSEMRYMYRDEE